MEISGDSIAFDAIVIGGGIIGCTHAHFLSLWGLEVAFVEKRPAGAGIGRAALVDLCKLAVGVRAYPEDGFSIAGALPGSQGLYIFATHSGVTLAPALGSHIADVVADGDVPKMLAPFGLDRLPVFG